jgi:hypothetical protein
MITALYGFLGGTIATGCKDNNMENQQILKMLIKLNTHFKYTKPVTALIILRKDHQINLIRIMVNKE